MTSGAIFLEPEADTEFQDAVVTVAEELPSRPFSVIRLLWPAIIAFLRSVN